MTLTDWIARGLFWACMFPAAAFVLLYALRSRWWVTDIGRIVMGLCLSVTYMTGLSLARFILDDFPGEDVFRIAGYLAINIGLWHMVATLLRIQNTTRNTPETGHAKDEKEKS